MNRLLIAVIALDVKLDSEHSDHLSKELKIDNWNKNCSAFNCTKRYLFLY